MRVFVCAVMVGMVGWMEIQSNGGVGLQGGRGGGGVCYYSGCGLEDTTRWPHVWWKGGGNGRCDWMSGVAGCDQ